MTNNNHDNVDGNNDNVNGLPYINLNLDGNNEREDSLREYGQINLGPK